jgi:hypothetical protein
MEKENIKLTLFIRANSAKNGPPLGTTLRQYWCKYYEIL